MTHRNRLIAAATAVAAAFLAPLLIAAPAAALTTGDDVLFYSNGTFTDVTQEDANMIAALEASGATVTTFDGGDGSLVAWAAALTASIDAFVIPENGNVWPSLLADVQALIAQWVADGGFLVLADIEDQRDIVSDVTGLDYDTPWASGTGSSYSLQITDPALLPEVQYANGTTSINTAGWGPDLLAIFTPIYADGTNVAVGRWVVGTGVIYGFGWDWYPDVADLGAGIPTPWNTAFTTLSLGELSEPELAATGGELLPLGAAAVALLLAGVIALAVRRRTSATD